MTMLCLTYFATVGILIYGAKSRLYHLPTSPLARPLAQRRVPHSLTHVLSFHIPPKQRNS
jgi:hypothetical protein